jgi:hypothetical protein
MKQRSDMHKSNGFVISDILFITAIVLGMMFIVFSMASCKHEPLEPEPVVETGTGTGGGGGGGNNGGIICDPDSVYFNQQVLPLLVSNCAMSGCHDAATAQDGVVLDSYSSVMATGDIDPFNPWNSDLFEVLVETDPDKRMPPPPAAALSQQQIAMIQTWIAQGAQNLTCDPNAGQCDTTSMSFSADIRPILQNSCIGCHNVNNVNGGVTLDSYLGVQTIANNGSLVGAITSSGGFVAMPYNANPLSDCNISKIRNWVNEGAQNN